MYRPHVVIPENLVGNTGRNENVSLAKQVAIDLDAWNLITDAMADVTTTGTAAMDSPAGN